MIKRLQLADDQLIKQFQSTDLQPILDNNLYHSPEDSETDQETDENLIVVKDLKWRSSTVSVSFFFENFVRFYTNYIIKLRQFLRDYIDRFVAERSRTPKKRTRIFSTNFNEKELSAPFSSPKWTLSGYSGRLKDVVQSIRDAEDTEKETAEDTEEETEETEGSEGTEETEETENTEGSKCDSDALSSLSFYYSSGEE
jgi:hypothetical protein